MATHILLLGRQDLAGLLRTGVPHMAGVCVPTHWQASELPRRRLLRAVCHSGESLVETIASVRF